MMNPSATTILNTIHNTLQTFHFNKAHAAVNQNSNTQQNPNERDR